jgi:hypothetical protein
MVSQHNNVEGNRFHALSPAIWDWGNDTIRNKEWKFESSECEKIEEVEMKIETDMIELTILEAWENIETYQKETKAWKDKKIMRKDVKTGD